MPGADVIAVVARTRVACGRAEVGEVPRGALGEVLVVAGHRPREGFQAAPARVIGVLVLGQRPVLVRVIAQVQHHVGVQRREQFGGRAHVARAAIAAPGIEVGRRGIARDVASGADDGIGPTDESAGEPGATRRSRL